MNLFSISSHDDAIAAVTAIQSYLDHPEYPQHQKIGKAAGGVAQVGFRFFWVWRTQTAWNAELER